MILSRQKYKDTGVPLNWMLCNDRLLFPLCNSPNESLAPINVPDFVTYLPSDLSHFDESPEFVSVTRGQLVTLSCHVESVPAPSVRWLKDGVNVDQLSQPRLASRISFLHRLASYGLQVSSSSRRLPANRKRH